MDEHYDPQTLRDLGFTDHREGYWYYVARVDSDTTLNITVNKASGNYTEQVLNEFSGQHEPYGHMKEPYRTKIRDNIDAELARFRLHGLKFTVDHAEYGWED